VAVALAASVREAAPALADDLDVLFLAGEEEPARLTWNFAA